MLTAIKHAGIIVSVCSLAACSAFSPNNNLNFPSYNDQSTELYPEGYENIGNYTDAPSGTHEVAVPDSPHVSAYRPPTSSKDVDHQWINSQNENEYTIEIAESDKASTVANSLQKAPASERKAEVEYQSGDRTLYKGIYGTYRTMDSAQAALHALPAEIQSNARIKTWSNVKGAVGN